MTLLRRKLIRIACSLGPCLLAPPALAIDGSNISGMSSGEETLSAQTAESTVAAPTYYEELVAADGAEELESSAEGLPTTLAIYDSTAAVSYVPGPRGGAWTLELRGLDRPHERIDTVYQMIAVLPLPFEAGEPAFSAKQLGFTAQEVTPQGSVPLVYGGEKIVLKRNVALEKSLLPGLIGSAYESDKLPSLEGTGYDYTLWDTIVRYDPGHGDWLRVQADVRYSTDDGVEAPDAGDERLKAYVITWIPGMDTRHPVFTVRIDVADPAD